MTADVIIGVTCFVLAGIGFGLISGFLIGLIVSEKLLGDD